MAPAVNATIKPDPDVVWSAADVSMAAVLEALDNLRKQFAVAEAQDAEHPHPRSCVMTLIALTSTDAEERRATRAARAIGKLHPAQLVVIRDQPDLRPGRIDAAIITDTHRPDASCCPIQCELVLLHVKGAAGEHLASLVDPLLQSGVPTYLWWVGTPPFGKRELADALRICDALVLDSARFEAPYRSLLELSRLGSSSHQRLGLADMQWARLEPWRETVAQFFAPADRRVLMNGITEVGVDYVGEGRGNRVAAALLIGWLSSALGWKLQKAAGGGGGIVAAHFSASDGWRPVQVAFRSVPKAQLAQGEVSAIRVAGAAGGRTFQLTVLRDPERPPRPGPDIGAGGYQSQHPAGGEDDAGLELAQRRATWHRDVLNGSRESLHHTATGDAPGESVSPPAVFVRERRRADNSLVLLTLIDIGGATLRHVQRVEPEDEAALLLRVLSFGTHDNVYERSLTAAAELMQAI